MNEALYFESAGKRLFGVLHDPARGAPPALGLAICPPIADEHVASYRILRIAADHFSRAGAAVMRFDYRGQGDSEGDFEDLKPEQMAADASRALDTLHERSGARVLGLLGLRVGCAIAMGAAALDSRVEFCAAWAPLPSAESYFRDLLRRQVLSDVMYGETKRSVAELLQRLQGGEPVDIGGYTLSSDLYEPLSSTGFAEQARETNVPLFAALAAREGKPGQALAESLTERSDTQLYEIAEEAFWQFPNEGSLAPPPSELIRRTAVWLGALATSRPDPL